MSSHHSFKLREGKKEREKEGGEDPSKESEVDNSGGAPATKLQVCFLFGSTALGVFAAGAPPLLRVGPT